VAVVRNGFTSRMWSVLGRGFIQVWVLQDAGYIDYDTSDIGGKCVQSLDRGAVALVPPSFSFSFLVRLVGSRVSTMLGPVPEWNVGEWAEPAGVSNRVAEGARHKVDCCTATLEFRGVSKRVEVCSEFRPYCGLIGGAGCKYVIARE
jgi:hypothetical protein